MKGLWILWLALSLSGCAFIDQSLRIAPQPTVSQVDIGHGARVALRVIDDRQEQMIGKRGYAYTGGAKISTDQDLAEVLRGVFVDGLRRKGFEPVGSNDVGIPLRVELRALSYDTTMGVLTGGNIGKAAVKVIATQPSGKTYEKTYRGQREIKTVFIGSQETNAAVINGALNDALDQIFSDEDLWNFLVM